MTFGLSRFLLVSTLRTGKGCDAGSTLTLSGHQDLTQWLELVIMQVKAFQCSIATVSTRVKYKKSSGAS